MRRKAVVFTHMDPRELGLGTDEQIHAYEKEVRNRFKVYLKYRNVGLFIVYVSKGLEGALKYRPVRGAGISVGGDALDEEARIINIQRMAWDRAREELSRDPAFSVTDAPRVVWVGLRELAHLLNTLFKIKPALVGKLAGKGSQPFTYDSPKFVEAVVRLVRGEHPELGEPILRFDSDVLIDDDAVGEILKKVEEATKKNGAEPFYFFSGWYKGPHRENPDCPVNSYAVRQHWLVKSDTWSNPKEFQLIGPAAERFMRDLGEVGATQVDGSVDLSTAGDALVQKRKSGSVNRKSPQVISGAGLVMSTNAIRALPPFMNATENIVWIDDHLKRQLHEALGHLSPDSLERVKSARFVQDRYERITGKDVEWAKKNYFKRLFLGCLMQAMIKDAKGQAGPLAKCIKEITSLERKVLTPSYKRKLEEKLRQSAEKRFDEVITLWRSADYGNFILRDWALAQNTGREKGKLCRLAAQNGVRYAELALVWKEYVFAIERLTPWDTYWAFMPIPKASPPKRPGVRGKPAARRRVAQSARRQAAPGGGARGSRARSPRGTRR